RADLNRLVGAVAAVRDARLQLAVALLQEDDAAVGVHELEQRVEDLLQQAIDVALEADLARQLPRDPQALVVHAELLRIMRDLIERDEALGVRGDLRPDRARAVED